MMHLNAQEIVQRSHVLHSKLGVQVMKQRLQQSFIVTGEDHIVDIHKQIDNVRALVINEQRRVWKTTLKAKLQQEIVEFVESSTQSLT